MKTLMFFIEEGIVSIVSKKDWFGVEEIYFAASDGEFSATSNIIKLTVSDAGEPPEFMDIDCETEIDEDGRYTCALGATDVEGNEFEFSIGDSNNLECDMESDELSYISMKDYNGMASCELIVSDIHGSSSLLFEVNVLPVNDAPKIKSSSPGDNDISIIEGNSQVFSIEAEDIDSEFGIEWYVNNKKQASRENEFTLEKGLGSYSIEARVFDFEFVSSSTWNVIVGPVSDFSCQEVGGFILDNGESCSGSLFGVKDSNSCCSVRGIPGFKDADSCKIIESSLKIEIRDPDDNDEFEIGDRIKIKIDIDNDYGEDQDFEVEVHLYNIDEDSSEEDESEDVEVDSGDSEDVEFDIVVPDDLDLDDDFVLFVKVEDDICNQEFIELDLERKDDHVIISKFDLPSKASCGESIGARVRVENVGSKDQDVEISLLGDELGIYLDSGVFELEEYDEDDKETKEFNIRIPDDASGEYEVVAQVSYNGGRDEITESVDVECSKREIVTSGSILADVDMLVLGGSGEVLELGREVLGGGEDERSNLLLISLIMTLDFVLIGGVMILYLVDLRKKRD